MVVAEPTERHPLIRAFRAMRLLRKDIVEEDSGTLTVMEWRKCPVTGSVQKLTYTLDSPVIHKV